MRYSYANITSQLRASSSVDINVLISFLNFMEYLSFSVYMRIKM